MSAFQIAGFAVCAAVLALLLRKLRPEASAVLTIAAGAMAVLMVLPQLQQIITTLAALIRTGGVQERYMTQLLKIGGISLLMDFAAQTCRDASEAGLAMKVEFAGRVMLIALALPVMQALLTQIISLSP